MKRIAILLDGALATGEASNVAAILMGHPWPASIAKRHR
jgi:hypothetical protein